MIGSATTSFCNGVAIGVVRGVTVKSEECIICEETPRNSSINIIIQSVQKEYPNKFCHKGCLEKLDCIYCGGNNGSLKYCNVENGCIHPNGCPTDLCLYCQDLIGTDEGINIKLLADNNKVVDKFVHKSCYQSKKCYTCNKIITTSDIVIDERGIRCSDCVPIECSDCKELIAKCAYKTILDKIYHWDCGPVCWICNSHTKDDKTDFIVLKTKTGLFEHVSCVKDLCPICELPLGNINSAVYVDLNYKSIKIHSTCSYKCVKCKILSPNESSFANNQLVDNNYRQFCKYEYKHSATGLYYLQKTKFIKSQDGMKLYMPKQICEIIIGMMLNIAPLSEGYLANCPDRKDFKMDQICNSYRCRSYRCAYCKHIIEWHQDNRNRCTHTYCIVIADGYNKILKLVFNQKPRNIRPLISKYPEQLLRDVAELFIKHCQTLSSDKILLYNTLVLSMKTLTDNKLTKRT
jgi:hypothetical protein